MTYSETLADLFRRNRRGIKPGLEATRDLASALESALRPDGPISFSSAVVALTIVAASSLPLVNDDEMESAATSRLELQLQLQSDLRWGYLISE